MSKFDKVNAAKQSRAEGNYHERKARSEDADLIARSGWPSYFIIDSTPAVDEWFTASLQKPEIKLTNAERKKAERVAAFKERKRKEALAKENAKINAEMSSLATFGMF